MATYYVRLSGSDSNNGTSPSTAWRTIGKALSGITSGNFTAGSSTTLTTSGLTASAWIGATITILTGTGTGSTGVVTANTTTQFTVTSWSGTAPSGSGTYQVTHLASSDQLWIGAGTYRETVTVSMVSATSEIKITGDVTGAYTGDGGEVILSGYINGDFGTPSGVIIYLSNRDYLTFETLTFCADNGWPIRSDTGVTGGTATNITFRNCTIFTNTQGGTGYCMYITNTFGESLNWIIENCRFLGRYGLFFSVGTSATGAHYNLNVSVRNTLFLCSASGVFLGPNTTSVFSGNGIEVTNCTFIGNGQSLYSQASPNTVYPVRIKNSQTIACSSGLYAAYSGQIIDDGGNRWNMYPGNVNVANHATSRAGSFPSPFPLEIGQSIAYGLSPRVPFMSYATSGSFPGGALGFGNVSGGTTTDILTNPRPSGGSVLFDSGTASSATASTLVDSTKNWPTSTLVGWLVRILSGQGAGQIKRISGNSATSLTISGAAPAGGQWAVTPDSTSAYVIYQGSQVETGKATSGTTSTLVDSNANWATGQWAGYTCDFDGQLASVASNTATTLTFAATVPNAPTASSRYSLYFPGASLTAALPAAGAFEGGNTGKVDTSTYLS